MNGKQAKRLRREVAAAMPHASDALPLEYKSDGANYTRKFLGLDDKTGQPVFDHPLRDNGTLRRNDKYRQTRQLLRSQMKGRA